MFYAENLLLVRTAKTYPEPWQYFGRAPASPLSSVSYKIQYPGGHESRADGPSAESKQQNVFKKSEESWTTQSQLEKGCLRTPPWFAYKLLPRPLMTFEIRISSTRKTERRFRDRSRIRQECTLNHVQTNRGVRRSSNAFVPT